MVRHIIEYTCTVNLLAELSFCLQFVLVKMTLFTIVAEYLCSQFKNDLVYSLAEYLCVYSLKMTLFTVYQSICVFILLGYPIFKMTLFTVQWSLPIHWYKKFYVITGDVDLDLESFIDKEVQCVDFHITNGQPELDLELNSGERVRKPIDVQKPSVTGANVCASKVMSADELLEMDDIEFQLHDYGNSPVLLKKSGSVTWTPIATRTRSRLSCNINRANSNI